MSNECMLDLEGYSDELPVQVGMAIFDPLDSYKIIDTLRVNIDPNTCEGRPNASTIDWWMVQSDQARAAILEAPRYPLTIALGKVNAFYREHKCVAMWSHAMYDSVVMSRVFSEIGAAPAWGRKGVADLRTLFSYVPKALLKQYYSEATLGLTDHIADHDCIKQVRVLAKVCTYLNIPARP